MRLGVRYRTGQGVRALCRVALTGGLGLHVAELSGTHGSLPSAWALTWGSGGLAPGLGRNTTAPTPTLGTDGYARLALLDDADVDNRAAACGCCVDGNDGTEYGDIAPSLLVLKAQSLASAMNR